VEEIIISSELDPTNRLTIECKLPDAAITWSQASIPVKLVDIERAIGLDRVFGADRGPAR
jgi:hypothetical protein